ncbi:MAG: phosphoglycerate kinase [Acidobacteriota bacterium]
MTRYRSVRDVQVEGRRVFFRADFNVPLEGGAIADDTRIGAALPTLEHLLGRGASVVVCSHLGRPKGRVVESLSLAPVAARLSELLPGRAVRFVPDVAGEEARAAARSLRAGEVLVLENVRFEPGETQGDEALARSLRELADLYVSEAFGAVHRPHASVCALPRLFPERAVGFLLEREVEVLEGRLSAPARPYVAFLGGAKVSDKIPILRGLLQRVDTLAVGGAMAYTFLKACGYEVGTSRVEPELLETCREILAEAEALGVRFLLPADHTAGPALDRPEEARTVTGEALPPGLAGFDVGPKTSALYGALAASAATIFWNGPMGVFEKPPFDRGTTALARALADSGAVTVVGGGDSVLAVNRAGVAPRIGHISTGGGASLELAAGLPLPGLEALALS